MSLHKAKPTSAGRRFVVQVKTAELHKGKPYAPLLDKKTSKGGRNNNGRITIRHQGGGHKQRYRIIDFKRNKDGIPGVVERLEYDPNRTARIALIEYADKQRSYILAPRGLEVGAEVSAGEKAAIKPGCALPLSAIPTGTSIHNLELVPGKGGQVARSAGQSCMLSNREGDYALIKMPSGEIRKVHTKCYATVGIVGNHPHEQVVSAKAGRSRWLGIRPTVRGMCMNPVDHPNGGGEGKSKSGGGRQHLKSPWGHVKGQRTRQKYKGSDKFIIERRKSKKRSR